MEEMQTVSILDYLERSENLYKYRPAVTDGKQELTWHELAVMARKIGSGISKRTEPGSPVPVLLEKSPTALAAMLGIAYAGCFYVPVNPVNPPERLKKILEKLEPKVIVTDEKGKDQLAEIQESELAVSAQTLLQEEVDVWKL